MGAGGPQRWAARFIAELGNRGYEVTHDPDSRFDAAYLSIDSTNMEKLPGRGIPFAYRVAGCYIPEWFDAMGKEMMDEHRHQNDSIRKALKLAPRVIYQSDWSKSQLDRTLYKRETNYVVIHNGVSSQQFRPSTNKNRELVIVSGGNLRYRFRLLTLFEVSQALDVPHSLLIAGHLDHESRDVLEKYGADSEIASRIRYIGDLSEAEWAEALQKCDILFHPVCGDACPNVVVEALMSGVPVITPRFGGASELIGPGGLAFECEPWRYSDPAFCANALTAIRSVIGDLQSYKHGARAHAEVSLTFEHMVDQYLTQLSLPNRVPIRLTGWRKVKSKVKAVFRRPPNNSSNQKLSIGYSFADLAFGGAQVFFVDLIERLSLRGHNIKYHLFAKENDPTLCDERLYYRINQSARKTSLRNVLSSDVIHLDGYHSSSYKKHFLSNFDKCVETYHSELSFEISGPDHVPNRIVISRALQTACPLDCELIYYGIDTNVFVPVDNKKDVDIAILGRIHPSKNHFLFLDVCRLIARERSLKAAIIGGYPWDDDYSREVRQRISELQQNGIQIEVTGFVPNAEVPSWLNRTRILLVTSPSEGFGRMAAEALACQVPVVANSVGGLSEIVRHGSNGFLINSGTAEEFARMTLSLLEDDSLRNQMGSQGRQDVLENFSVDVMIQQYERLYRIICDKHLRTTGRFIK